MALEEEPDLAVNASSESEVALGVMTVRGGASKSTMAAASANNNSSRNAKGAPVSALVMEESRVRACSTPPSFMTMGVNLNEKHLVLKSPMPGVDDMLYQWPLKKGKGSLRRSEDQHDEAAEIVETIRWVCEDNPTIRSAMEGSDYLLKFDRTSYETMTAICDRYNKAVENYLNSKETTSQEALPMKKVTRAHLRHIIQKCYNKSVIDPNELNHYEAFTPEVYGETSFELICQILDKLHPISSSNRFIDLGSGVGQVVLQVAALTDCSISLGIEKANNPAKFAKNMEESFKYWMSFYGKPYSPFKLIHGDFLDRKNRQDILDSTILFVNNFAFGPEVDQHLKDIFADLNDGARIFSSKSFCALNFRITERNLSDIGTIMHVSQLDPLKGSVSWTGKPVSYYLHVIDRAKLERYFIQIAAARKEGEHEGSGRRVRRGKRGDNGNSNVSSICNSNDNSLLENGLSTLTTAESSCDSRDISRASSIEKEEIINGIVIKSQPDTPTAVIEDEESNSSTVSKRSTLKRAGHLATSKRLTSAVQQLNEDEDYLLSMSLDGSSAALSKKRKGRPKKGIVSATVDRNADKNGMADGGLDNLHKVSLEYITASKNDDSVPEGCVQERLNAIAPRTCLEHVELAESLRADGEGGHIPHQLLMFLEKIKYQYLSFIRQMQEPSFKERVEADIDAEKKRKTELEKREKQLKGQIENLLSDSQGLLVSRLGELGIRAKTSPEFIERAKGIVCNHHDLQKRKENLESEVLKLELESERAARTKEYELFQQLAASERNASVSQTHLRDHIRREIESILFGSGVILSSSDNKVSPLLNKLSDVTFTKCPSTTGASLTHASSLNNSSYIDNSGTTSAELITTQIRKRPRDANHKQRDWPEKRSKTSALLSPEVSSRKGHDENRELERKTSAATLIISPTKSSSYGHSLPQANRSLHPPVEVRKIEPISPPLPRQAPPASSSLSPTKMPRTGPSLVDLPKIDLAASMQASSSSAHQQGGKTSISVHPDSRNRTSERFPDDVPFAKSKMSTTPRAEQFEDRLKTIIHSVLSSDDAAKATQSSTTSSSYHGQPQHPNMLNQVKRDHLPPHSFSRGPNVATSLPFSQLSSNSYGGQKPLYQHKPPAESVSSRSINDIITSEIERSLPSNAVGQPAGPTSPSVSQRRASISEYSQKLPTSSNREGSGMPSMARMSQVIEDTIRGGQMPYGCYPSKNSSRPVEKPTRSHDSAPAYSNDTSSSRTPPTTTTTSSTPRGEYPAIEGLAARFGPYMDKANREHQQAKRAPSPSRSPIISSSGLSLASPPLLMPKKQDPDAGPASNGPQEESKREWQETISSGFDRLVAFAEEVDKRRKSSDSSTSSPRRLNSSPHHRNRKSTVEEVPHSESSYEKNRMSTLSMKFKGAARYQQQRSYPSSPPHHLSSSSTPPGSSSSRAATPHSNHSTTNPRSPLPGENLPDHHPKKRYFAETSSAYYRRSVSYKEHSESSNNNLTNMAVRSISGTDVYGDDEGF